MLIDAFAGTVVKAVGVVLLVFPIPIEIVIGDAVKLVTYGEV